MASESNYWSSLGAGYDRCVTNKSKTVEHRFLIMINQSLLRCGDVVDSENEWSRHTKSRAPLSKLHNHAVQALEKIRPGCK